MLRNQLQAGELDARDYRLLRRGACLAYSLEQPVRKSARRRVQTEKDAGRLEKPERCERCGAAGELEAHHPDYSRPLTVVWCCGPCHVAADAEQAGKVPERVR
jgi:ribosomal protein S27AE